MKSHLVFIGAPGSGKGTQSKKLKEQLAYIHISTGDLLRMETEKGTDLGKKILDIMNAGQLVNDTLVMTLLKDHCDLNTNSYIFDGFPRNIDQAGMLDNLLLKDKPHRAIFFDLKYDDLIERIHFRRLCPKCGKIYNLKYSPPKDQLKCDFCLDSSLIHRKDDNEEILKNRYEIYLNTIGPVIDFYKKKNVLLTVDASESPDTIFQFIKKNVS